jgi:hypothetical protein
MCARLFHARRSCAPSHSQRDCLPLGEAPSNYHALYVRIPRPEACLRRSRSSTRFRFGREGEGVREQAGASLHQVVQLHIVRDNLNRIRERVRQIEWCAQHIISSGLEGEGRASARSNGRLLRNQQHPLLNVTRTAFPERSRISLTSNTTCLVHTMDPHSLSARPPSRTLCPLNHVLPITAGCPDGSCHWPPWDQHCTCSPAHSDDPAHLPRNRVLLCPTI